MHRIFKKCGIVFAIVFCIFLSACGDSEDASFQEITMEELDEKGTSGEMESDEAEAAMIFVHVCGEVNSPGVYELREGSRIFEAVNAAGGMTKTAAENSINQAQILSDGQQVYIPSEEEAESQEKESRAKDYGKVNINQASKEELMELSGIGEAKADAIIRHREEKGNFSSIEEIMEIEGIKEGVFRKIQDQITVS